MAKKKPDEKTGRFEIRGGRDARTGRFATVTVERIPNKGIVKKTIDAKREGVSFSYASSIAETPTGLTKLREPKLAHPVHADFDLDAFADELLETDSEILAILAK
ncbi:MULTISPECIES: hypothetical protein [unclassified Rhizobium]|uniref:hypothetical protein n=1 Tax=unclassified Rhizobium TaxID=2613769 RepID=UPI0007EA2A8D|nr:MULTISPECIES: hypothetical protein [unclassified Rhizobium]ANL12023.1 hypothetical protein AMJ98_PA00077 [Rhizobium sp. N1341]ANM42868.1 hypothetical protein AMK03_PA00077 [Rhizobium sp. N741]